MKIDPKEVGGLVAELRRWSDEWPHWQFGDAQNTALQSLFTTLEAQAAKLAAKEEARAEQWRQRREAGGSRDVARAACDTMRIERDDARAALAEARKALEPFASAADKHHRGYSDSAFSLPIIKVGHLRAARRALTGGQEDG